MSVQLKVQISDQTGLAYTCVPRHAMWELVEYLATQRTMVLYEGFTVTFQRLGQNSAQKLLDEWAAAQISAAASPRVTAPRPRVLNYIPG